MNRREEEEEGLHFVELKLEIKLIHGENKLRMIIRKFVVGKATCVGMFE